MDGRKCPKTGGGRSLCSPNESSTLSAATAQREARRVQTTYSASSLWKEETEIYSINSKSHILPLLKRRSRSSSAAPHAEAPSLLPLGSSFSMFRLYKAAFPS